MKKMFAHVLGGSEEILVPNHVVVVVVEVSRGDKVRMILQNLFF
jgi:hypothetical protein